LAVVLATSADLVRVSDIRLRKVFHPPRKGQDRAVRYSALTAETCTGVFWLPDTI